MSDALAACEGRSTEKRKDLVLIVCITLRRWTVTAHARSTPYPAHACADKIGNVEGHLCRSMAHETRL